MKTERKRKRKTVSRKRLSAFAMTVIYLAIAAIIIILVINSGQLSDASQNTPTATVTTTEEDRDDTSDIDGTKNTDASTSDTGSDTVDEWDVDTDHLSSLVIEYISGLDGKYGIYFIDIDSGKEFGINETDEFIAASTTKLPMNMLLYRRIESCDIDPEQLLTYTKEDFEVGTGIVQNEPYGTKYTVRETTRLAMVYSDNCANNMIIRLLGIDDIRDYMTGLGGVVYYGSRHRTCPRDMALYAKELYRFYIDNPDVVGEMVYNLQHTEFNDRINALLPDDVPVAHKIGNYDKTANDVGIVFTEHPYILSVYSADVHFNTACTAIAELSRLIYDFLGNT